MSFEKDSFGRTELTHAILRHKTQRALQLVKECPEVNERDRGGIFLSIFCRSIVGGRSCGCAPKTRS